MSKKKTLGQYFTTQPVWLTKAVGDFISSKQFSSVIDPFAGRGDLLQNFSCRQVGYDIDPTLDWPLNDGLIDVPIVEDAICVTNPPYLASNTAKRFGREDAYQYFEANPEYVDLYQIALDRCLASYGYVVAIIPETFLSSGLFRDRLVMINVLEKNPFEDTEFPTLVACWGPDATKDFEVYKDDEYLSSWSEIQTKIPRTTVFGLDVKFNVIESDIGLIGIDGTKSGQNLRFCDKEEILESEIKHSSRLRTRIKIEYLNEIDPDRLITEANAVLKVIRDQCADVILSPFKGNNEQGVRRRRLDYAMAKKVLHQAVFNLENK